jgi:hypothetical protein
MGEKMEKTIRRAVISGTLILFCAGPLMKAQQAGSLSQQQGPTLEETLLFMNNSVAPENSYVSSANHCEAEIVRNQLYTFAIPTGTYVKSTDQYGIPHSAITWMVMGETAQFIRFNFQSIDPKSIKSKAVPSNQFLKDHDVDNHPEALKYPDLMAVFFKAANSENSIEFGKLPAHDSKSSASGFQVPVFDQKNAAAFIVFESQDRAERFVTAFVHAVELCGGKGSDFAPTPSEH